jgi:hypothetical protein
LGVPRIVLACIIGFFSFFAWFGGGSFFQTPGLQSGWETIGGSVVLVLFLVLGQLVLPRDPVANAAEDWRVRACMAAPLLPFALLVLLTEGERQSASLAWMLIAGCVGVLAGGILAGWLPKFAQSDTARAAASVRFLGNTSAALNACVAVMLSAFIVPGLSGAGGRGMVAVAVLHVAFAAAVLWRTRPGNAPVLLAPLGLLMALMLVGLGAAQSARESSMRVATIVLFAGAALDLAALVCLVRVALQRRDAPQFLEENPQTGNGTSF